MSTIRERAQEISDRVVARLAALRDCTCGSCRAERPELAADESVAAFCLRVTSPEMRERIVQRFFETTCIQREGSKGCEGLADAVMSLLTEEVGK